MYSGKPQPDNRKNSEYQLHDRRKQVAQMYLQGKTQWDIARAISVSQSLVCQDLKAIREQWLASMLQDFDEKKAQELAKIDNIEEVAWIGYHRSCEDAETKRTTTEQRLDEEEQSADGDKKPKGRKKAGKSKMTTVKIIEDIVIKGQAGDKGFLATVQWCVEMRCKIFNFIKPDKQNNVVVINWDQLAQDAMKEMTTQVDPVTQQLNALPAPESHQHNGNGNGHKNGHA